MKNSRTMLPCRPRLICNVSCMPRKKIEIVADDKEAAVHIIIGWDLKMKQQGNKKKKAQNPNLSWYNKMKYIVGEWEILLYSRKVELESQMLFPSSF